ncbi:MAG: 50S ribosomal protein L18 [Candidatus Pelagibacter sp.]|nr:50S ribosomal protein L18 [Candidatus Pelagibacter sp.]OUV98417.1 MAG: 50S ribosomal protein L18 [Candidatus Pelagibacter sp. TMED142]|tara:strand:- start:57 stop:398 length:342 start_codon:yes stop_codon:yes gene_type:complete
MKNIALKRKSRIRSKLKKVNSDKPRLTVFRSLKNIYAQIIDDNKHITIVSASSKEKNFDKMSKSKISAVVGKLIAERSVKKGVKEVFFDRGNYKYHGRIKLLAETARKEGLKF